MQRFTDPRDASASPGPMRLGELARRERLILCAIVLGGALLRIAYQVDRPFEGDEIGTLIFLKKDYGTLFTQFGSWLTMNVYQAGLKALASLAGNSPWTLVAPSLLAGVALVPTVAAVTLRLSSAHHALLAAALTAFNPFLVHYSVQIRSYMLLTWFALLATLAFLDWSREPRLAHGVRVALWCAAAFLIHPNGIYTLGALALLCVLWRRPDRRANWNRAEARALASVVVPTALAMCGAFLVYRPLLADMAVFRAEWSYTPPTNVIYLPRLFEDYFGGGYSSLAMLILLVAGMWSAARHRVQLAGLGVLIGAPMVFVSLMGVSHFPWAYSRFLLPILPLALILLAFPACLARSRVGACALALVPLVAWTPGLVSLFAENRDHPWNAIAAQLAAEVGPRDRILAVDYMSQHELSGQDRGYEERFVTGAALVKLSRPRSQEVLERLWVVCDEPHLVTAAENRSFGAVQVVTYHGEPPAILAQLIDDLAASTRGRIESELTSAYKLLHELLDASKHESEAKDALVRMLNCQSILQRERLRPIQQR